VYELNGILVIIISFVVIITGINASQYSETQQTFWNRKLQIGEVCTICGCPLKAAWYNTNDYKYYNPKTGVAHVRQEEWVVCSKTAYHDRQITGNKRVVLVDNKDCNEY
jgi:hypothetical protein